MPISLAGSAGLVRTLSRTLTYRSPSMMSSAPRPSMRSLPPPPSRMLPAPQTLPSSRHWCVEVAAIDAARQPRGRPCSIAGGDELVEPGDPGDTSGVERVAPDESATADVRRHDVVTTEGVVEGAAGEGLDLVELVPDPGEDHAAGDEHLGEVRVLGLGVAEADLPVEAGRTGHLLDTGTGDTDVVATLHVVVVVPTLTDQDVVAGDVVVVEEERRAVTDEEVRLVAALFPVVSAVAEDGVDALAADGEVVAGAARRSRCCWRHRW